MRETRRKLSNSEKKNILTSVFIAGSSAPPLPIPAAVEPRGASRNQPVRLRSCLPNMASEPPEGILIILGFKFRRIVSFEVGVSLSTLALSWLIKSLSDGSPPSTRVKATCHSGQMALRDARVLGVTFICLKDGMPWTKARDEC